MKQLITTLVFLRRGDQILLAMKKRGFGAGKWNGIGGKLDPGESLEQAMIRECQEEICVTPTAYQHVATHTFQVHYNNEPSEIIMQVFLCTEWQGKPAETEEMAPQWFALRKIPYAQMWEDDKFWLPAVLDGKLLTGRFAFDENDTMLDHTITEVTSLE